MKFRDLIESGDVNQGKKFEDDIVTLALLCGENLGEDLDKLYAKNSDKFLSPPTKSQTIAAVTALNKKFLGEQWTDGYNSNKHQADITPNYGQASAKSDIVLNDIPFSVKMSGSFVILSAQSKSEFGGVFQYAINKYMEDKGIELEVDSSIKQLQETFIEIRDTYIGEVFQQVKSKRRQLSVAKKFSDTADLYEQLRQYMEDMQDKIEDTYKDAIQKLKEEVLVKLKTSLDNNQELKEYVTWEALSSTLKYDGKFPYAPYVLSPKGVSDISKPDTPYVKACAKESKFSIRGLPTGGMRSGSKTYAKQQTSAYEKGTVDVAGIFAGIGSMAMNLKVDISDATSRNLPIDEAFDIRQIWDQLVSIVKSVMSKLAKKFNKIISDITELFEATPADWVTGLGIEADGEIKMV